MRGAILGIQGSGKTALLSYFGYYFYLKGTQIYSNYKVKFPHFIIEEPEQIFDIQNGFALLDELWQWLDARCSQSKKNRIISNILSQARKKRYSFCYTSQVVTGVDLRVRHICTHVYFPTIKNHAIIHVEGYRRQVFDWLYLKPFNLSIAEVGKLYYTLRPTYDLEKSEEIKA